MVYAYPYDDDTFVPDEGMCVTFMNGKTDLLALNPRYAGYEDLTQYVTEDEKIAAEIAKLLRMTVKHYRDINF